MESRKRDEKEYERGDDRERVEEKSVRRGGDEYGEKVEKRLNIERRLRRAWREEGTVGKGTEKEGGRGLHDKVSKKEHWKEEIRKGGVYKRREGRERKQRNRR
jgi:hypothetical protein